MVRSPEGASNHGVPAATPEPSPAKPTPKADGPVTIQKLRAAWTTIRGRVEAERPPLRGPLSGAMVTAVDGDTATLKLRTKFDADILKEHAKLLETAIADVLGAKLHVKLDVAPRHPEDSSAASKGAPSAEAPPPVEEESVDELFGYANERIK